MSSPENPTLPSPSTELLPFGVSAAEAAMPFAAPVNYGAMIGGNSVLLVREWHDNTSVRQHLAEQAPAIAKQGITHYAIEAPHNPILDGLNASNADTYDLCGVRVGPWDRVDPGYEKAVRAMAKEGLKVVGVGADISDSSLGPKREADMTYAVEEILEKEPNAKILCLMGGEHGMPGKAIDGPVLVTRLKNDGVSVVTAQHYGGVHPDKGQVLLEAAANSGQQQEEFMLNLKVHPGLASALDRKDAPDFAIHLPPGEPIIPNISGILGALITKLSSQQ